MAWAARRWAAAGSGIPGAVFVPGREGGDGGGGLGDPGAIKKIVTCLSEGAARGRVQNLPFSWENRELKFCKKIHSNYGSSYCCKKKIKFEILVGESNGLAAAAPDWDNVPICAHEVRTCGQHRA